MDALSAPLFRSLLLAALATGSIAAYSATRDDAVTRRLALHAPSQPNAIYMSAWDRGDVHVTFPDSKITGIVFYNRAWLDDGCRWLATETLTPMSGNAFFYEYSETILECKPGATHKYIKTPRTGMVTIED